MATKKKPAKKAPKKAAKKAAKTAPANSNGLEGRVATLERKVKKIEELIHPGTPL